MFKGSTASEDLTEVVRALKSAAEPTRLRLLVLLSHGEFTVGELCAVLGQSQPRISRHLRLLTDAGFLDRFREQQCVYYRAPVIGRHLEWSRQLLSMLEPDGAVLRRDRERAVQVVRARAAVAARQLAGSGTDSADQNPGDELANVLIEELGPSSVGEMLDIGTGAGLMLEVLGPKAEHAVGIDISAPALRLARTRVHGVGLSHCEFRRGDMYRLPVEDGAFDLVTMERVLARAEPPLAVLLEAGRALRADGRLVAVEDFEQLAARGDGNPLMQLRSWLKQAGFGEIRLRPCDLAGRHIVIAVARRGSQPLNPIEATLQRPGSFIPRQQGSTRL